MFLFVSFTSPLSLTQRNNRKSCRVRCALPNGDSEGEGPPRYMPKVEPSDPIVAAIAALAPTHAGRVTNMELLDTRWNGNEAFRIDLEGDKPPIFAKINRVEDPSVFMSEAVGLTAMLNASESMRAPKPLHIGRLPRVGDYGPGAFLLLQWFDLAPFGAQRAGVQAQLANMIADMHEGGPNCERVHGGRFGFPSNNFLALTPMDNTWMDSWPAFFSKRLAAQVSATYKDKPYGRAPLKEEDLELKEVMQKVVDSIDYFFRDVKVRPSLLHGDLWVGNVGATKSSEPVVYDPACFFGHHEFDLAIMRMYGGFTDEFWQSYFERFPKEAGFEDRARLYELYQYLNQLNLFGDPKVKEKVEELAKELISFLPKSTSKERVM